MQNKTESTSEVWLCAPCQFFQWVCWEGFSQLGRTHEILLASENTPLPSSLWDCTCRGVLNLTLSLNQRDKKSQLQRLIRPKTQHYKTWERAPQYECVFVNAIQLRKRSISLILQDAPAAQAGPLVSGMREPTTQGGSLQSFQHVMFSPSPGQGN